MIRKLSVLLVLVAIVGCGKKENASAETLFLSAEICADCHADKYAEWKGSMHAKSAPMSDKVHAAVFKMTGNDIKTGKDGKVPVCVNCHVPIAALDGEVDLTKRPIYAEGVTCTFCHKIKSLKPDEGRGLGAHAYEFNEGNVYSSAIKNPDSDGHGASYNPLYKKSEFCNGCHEKRATSKGVSVCNTYGEYKTSSKSTRLKMTCQNCHMSTDEGRIADSSNLPTKVHYHGTSGGHNIDKVKSAVKLELKLDVKGDKFSVVVKNVNAGHKVPTAAPLRQLFVKVVQLGKGGGIITENYKENPKEDKNALFIVAFKDIDGNIGVPPWKAESIAYDKRIKPDGERIIMYDLAGKKVKRVRVELYYRLVPEGFPKPEVYDSFDDYTKQSHLLITQELEIE